MRRGTVLFSPIAYGHYFNLLHGTPTDHLAWQRFNDHMLFNASVMWVLRLGGWQESKGIAAEISMAKSLKKKILYKDMHDAEIQQPQS